MNSLTAEIDPIIAVQSAPIVRAENVRKAYIMGANTLEVLRGINLSVQPGEFLALCGASGAGKSTLLHLLIGKRLRALQHGVVLVRLTA